MNECILYVCQFCDYRVPATFILLGSIDNMENRMPVTTSSSYDEDDYNDDRAEEVEDDEEEEDEEEEEDDDDDDEQESDKITEPALKFRNYKPQTKFLQGMYSTWKSEPESILPHIEDKLKLLSEGGDDPDNKYKITKEMLESKKVDWDLKRRIEKRMEKLERETRKNIEKHIKTRTKQ